VATESGPFATIQSVEKAKAEAFRVAVCGAYDLDIRSLKYRVIRYAWQRIVPDTIGERLYNGACSQAR
jgi:hypothetical protein